MAKGLIYSPVMISILQTLINDGPIDNISQLSDNLLIHRPSASRAVHVLTKLDLVTKSGRAVEVTAKGKEVFKSLIPAVNIKGFDLKSLQNELIRLRASYKQLETHARWLDNEMTKALKDGGIKREWAYSEDHHVECSCGREVWPGLETVEGQ
jgi:DNA-binding MarR family transcriptional regulator